jgi:hypothetical protein
MSRVRRLSIVLALLLALPGAPARAQHGNGLYEPFPKAAVRERAKRFIERLPTGAEGVRFSDARLARGVFIDPRRVGLPARDALPVGGRAASERAGVDGGGTTVWPWVLVGLVALGAAFALGLGAGRRVAARA